MPDQEPQPPVTHVYVVMSIVCAMAVLALTGLCGTIYLCRTSTNPELVAAAVKMIQTDPSSALAAYGLLRTDSAVIAIVAGLTGTALGLLGGLLGNTRTQQKPKIEDATVVKEVIRGKDSTITTTTTTPVSVDPAIPAKVEIVNPPESPANVQEVKHD